MNLVLLSSHKSFWCLLVSIAPLSFYFISFQSCVYLLVFHVLKVLSDTQCWLEECPFVKFSNKKVKENRHINPMCDIKTVSSLTIAPTSYRHEHCIVNNAYIICMANPIWVWSKCVKKIHYRVVLYITFHQDWSLLLKV